ncbi:hypothetical protein H1P_140051 [Hyella patelloides LEGE 07179]|uniref:Uncharacterized protein n=1 Tax=Hyella patelloides LEGE 07179 TaxID=945734 RepID=A0A563VLH6_9CYAN|nr:hypothetical protein [Hyella patelloides]VEP12268.1 hypothetical protein H1P_140051 [Hyella patelloides LEGE 07179]
MVNEIDTVFVWESKGDYVHNRCRVRIYWITEEKAVIIATDVTKNPGRKVANVSKEIISFFSNLYNLVPGKTMLVEHYPMSNLPDGDIYLQVLFVNKEAMRYEIGRNELKQLLGKPIQ